MNAFWLVILVSLSIGLFIGFSFLQLEQRFGLQVKEEFAKHPLKTEEIMTEQDIAHLPAPVKRYLHYVGAVGKPMIQNFKLHFSAEMLKSPQDRPMKATSIQYNFTENPVRLFFMKARMLGLPVQVFHSYREHAATMRVRLASLYNAVDLSGEVLNETETVTLFNDFCFYAPTVLASDAVSFEEIDELSVKASYRNGPYKISAILYFNAENQLVNFTSEDRSAGPQKDGSFRKIKFFTPVRDYQDFHGRKVATYGEATWGYPEGDFVYGKFTVTNVEYNLRD